MLEPTYALIEFEKEPEAAAYSIIPTTTNDGKALDILYSCIIREKSKLLAYALCQSLMARWRYLI